VAYEVGDIVQINVVFTINNTRGTIRKATYQLEVEDPGGYTNGDTIMVAGAGIGGRDLITTISSVVANTITLSDLAGTTVTNTDVGKAADPATVTITITAPDGAQTSYSGGSGVVLDGPGQYHANYTAAAPGVHYWEAHGTATATGTMRGYFEVDPAPTAGLSARALCTLGELKQFLGNVTATDDDANLIAAINAASAELHREADREFVALNAVRDLDTGIVTVAPQARRFDLDSTLLKTRTLVIGDMAATTWDIGGTLTITTATNETAAATVIDPAGLAYLPRNRLSWQPITRIRFPLTVFIPWLWGTVFEITAVWGFPAVPDDIHQAALKYAAGSYLRDVRRWAPTADDAGRTLPASMIGSALATARAYRTDAVIV
jgi:hypothetical protein